MAAAAVAAADAAAAAAEVCPTNRHAAHALALIPRVVFW